MAPKRTKRPRAHRRRRFPASKSLKRTVSRGRSTPALSPSAHHGWLDEEKPSTSPRRRLLHIAHALRAEAPATETRATGRRTSASVRGEGSRVVHQGASDWASSRRFNSHRRSESCPLRSSIRDSNANRTVGRPPGEGSRVAHLGPPPVVTTTTFPPHLSPRPNHDRLTARSSSRRSATVARSMRASP